MVRACRIRYIVSEGQDVMDADKEIVQNALIEHMVKFERVLKSRIKDLEFDSTDAA